MRPTRIIVGEVREAESLDLLVALNSGLPGMGTIHANSARAAITKICTLPLLAGANNQLGMCNWFHAGSKARLNLIYATARRPGVGNRRSRNGTAHVGPPVRACSHSVRVTAASWTMILGERPSIDELFENLPEPVYTPLATADSSI